MGDQEKSKQKPSLGAALGSWPSSAALVRAPLGVSDTVRCLEIGQSVAPSDPDLLGARRRQQSPLPPGRRSTRHSPSGQPLEQSGTTRRERTQLRESALAGIVEAKLDIRWRQGA